MSRELRCTYSFRFYDKDGDRHTVHEITAFDVQVAPGDVTVTPEESHLETIYGERVVAVNDHLYCTSAGMQLWTKDPRAVGVETRLRKPQGATT